MIMRFVSCLRSLQILPCKVALAQLLLACVCSALRTCKILLQCEVVDNINSILQSTEVVFEHIIEMLLERSNNLVCYLLFTV